MKTRCIALALIMVFVLVAICRGQVVGDKERNVRYLDSIRQAVEHYYCQGDVKYSESYDKKEVDKVVSMLKLLNFFVKNDIAAYQVDSVLSRIRFKNVNEYNDLNGLLKTITVKAVLEYLSVTVKLVYIDEFVIEKKIVLIPLTTVQCSNYGNGLPDFKLLTDVCAKYIDYPIRLVDLSYLLMNKFNLDNLAKASVKHREYRCFFEQLSGSEKDWIYGLFLKQYDPDSSCCYSYVKGEEDLIRLIKEEKYNVIRDLVFSPNYFYAINAMEAVLYLSDVGKLPLDDQLKRRMDELKTKDFKIRVRRASDVLSWEDGYKSINASDEDAVRKYQRSLQ